MYMFIGTKMYLHVDQSSNEKRAYRWKRPHTIWHIGFVQETQLNAIIPKLNFGIKPNPISDFISKVWDFEEKTSVWKTD